MFNIFKKKWNGGSKLSKKDKRITVAESTLVFIRLTLATDAYTNEEKLKAINVALDKYDEYCRKLDGS